MAMTTDDLTLLLNRGYDRESLSDTEYEDFGRYPIRIPGRDRHIRITYSLAHNPDLPWSAVVDDRDDDGDTYTEASKDFATVKDAMVWADRYPWTPPLKRLAELLTEMAGRVETGQPVYPYHAYTLMKAMDTALETLTRPTTQVGQ
jgi:hypothetical protein